MLEDAGQRQVKDASVRNWLDKLKEVPNMMVDVVDEWNSESLKQQVEKQEREGTEGGKALAIQKQKKNKKKEAKYLNGGRTVGRTLPVTSSRGLCTRATSSSSVAAVIVAIHHGRLLKGKGLFFDADQQACQKKRKWSPR